MVVASKVKIRTLKLMTLGLISAYSILRSPVDAWFLKEWSGASTVNTSLMVVAVVIFFEFLRWKFGRKHGYLLNLFAILALSTLIMIVSVLVYCYTQNLYIIFWIKAFKEAYHIILFEMIWAYITIIFLRRTISKGQANGVNVATTFLMPGVHGGLLASGASVLLQYIGVSTSGVVAVGLVILGATCYPAFMASRKDSSILQKSTSLVAIPKLLRDNPNLVLLLISILILHLSSACVDVNFMDSMKNQHPVNETLSMELSKVSLGINLMTWVLHLGFPAIVKRFGIKVLVLVVPSIFAFGWTFTISTTIIESLTMVPMLPAILMHWIAIAFKMASKAFDYSAFKIMKEFIYSRFSKVDIINIKLFIDVYSPRIAKVVTFLFFIYPFKLLPNVGISIFCLTICIGWLLIHMSLYKTIKGEINE